MFLAGKVTEAARRLRDVINVLHMLTSSTQDEPPLLDKVGLGRFVKGMELACAEDFDIGCIRIHVLYFA